MGKGNLLEMSKLYPLTMMGNELPQPDFPASALFQVPADEEEADRQIKQVDLEIEAENG